MAITTERPAATTTAPGIDPITAEVIRGSMETVCYEMATHVSLTATTPILNQSNERNATIMDADGRLAALSVGIPQFMLSSTLPVQFALEFFGRDDFHEGDVFVANDPYHGGAFVDHDPKGNRDIHVRVTLTVEADQLTVDFDGSDMRQNLGANSTFGNTRGYVVAQLASAMDPSIPKNEGFFASIDLRIP